MNKEKMAYVEMARRREEMLANARCGGGNMNDELREKYPQLVEAIDTIIMNAAEEVVRDLYYVILPYYERRAGDMNDEIW